MGGEEVNNGTRGQRHSILPANPVASIRLEELLVRDGRSNPVRKYRVGGRAKRCCRWFWVNHTGCNRHTHRTTRDANAGPRKTMRGAKRALCRRWRVC